MKTPAFTLLRVCCWFLCAALTPTLAKSDHREGYRLLFENRTEDALAHFRSGSAGGTPEQRAAALRGMGLSWELAGNGDSSVAAYLRAFHTHPDADLLGVHLVTMLEHLRGTHPGFREEFRRTAARLNKEFPAHPLRADFHQEFGHYLPLEAEPEQVVAYFDQIPVVRNWKWAGPFDNVSNAGILDAGPPEKGFDFSERYTGLSGMPVQWRDLRHQNQSGWIHLDHHQNIDNALNYFATSVNSPRQQKVVVSFGVSGVFALWINGQRVAHNEVFQNTGMEGYRIPIQLQKGWNSVLVKLGHEDRQMSNFILRFSESGGKALALEAQPRAQTKVQPRGGDQAADRSVEERLRARYKKDTADLSHLLELARYHIYREELPQAKGVLAQLRKSYPESALIEALSAQVYTREGNRTLGELHWERCARLDPRNSQGWHFQFNRRVGREAWSEVVEAFEQRPPLLETSAEMLMNYIRAQFRMANQVQGIAYLDTLEARFPGDVQTSLFLAEVFKAMGNAERAQKVLLQLRGQEKVRPGVANALLRHYAQQGEEGEAVSVAESALRYQPQQVSLYEALANIHFQRRRYGKALQAALKGLEVNPFHGELLKILGKTYEQTEDIPKALGAYDRVLALPEADFELADRVQRLRGQAALGDLQTVYSLDSLIAAGRQWELGRRENSLILLAQRSVQVYQWGGFAERERWVVEMLDPQGVDAWKEYRLEYASNYEELKVLRAVTRKPDGKTLDADRRGLLLVFTNLEPGDHIEIEVLRQHRFIGTLAGHFWTRHQFAHRFPVMHSMLELFTPASQKYTIKQHNINAGPVETKIGKLRAVRFAKGHLITPPAEEVMPPWHDALSWVQVSSIPDWGFIARWYHQLTEGKSVPTEELRTLAASLFRGVTSDSAKVVQVHEFITRQIRYSYQSFRQSGYVPQASARTLATRMGDCKDMATLARTLLRLGGVQSDLVLVESNDRGRTPVLPSIEFNHCILAVGNTYIDFTADNNAWNALPRSNQGARSLRIAPKSGVQAASLPFLAPAQERTVRISHDTLLPDGTFRRHLQTRRTGNPAASMRGHNRFVNPQHSRANLVRTLQSDHPTVELGSYEFQALDSINAELGYTYDYTAPGSGVVSQQTMVMRFPWVDAFNPRDLPGEKERHFPVDLWRRVAFLGENSHRMELVLPADWTLLDLPPALDLRGKWGHYRTQYTHEGNRIIAQRDFTGIPLDYTPAQYDALRRELSKIVDSDRGYLVLQSRGN